MATFKEVNSRKVDNVKHLKSFFLDLDCGPTKEFASQEEAIKELRKFCTTNSLPNPTMINSGRGVHVYWFLDESVCYDDSDAARVLRIPDTHNYKTNPPSDVNFFGLGEPIAAVGFDTFSELLGGEMIPVPTKHIPKELSQTMHNLMGNQENVFKDILVKTLRGDGCQQLYDIIRHQEETSEPLWRAGLSIAKFCTDSEKAMHVISKNQGKAKAD